jgi:hypothetical protein
LASSTSKTAKPARVCSAAVAMGWLRGSGSNKLQQLVAPAASKQAPAADSLDGSDSPASPSRKRGERSSAGGAANGYKKKPAAAQPPSDDEDSNADDLDEEEALSEEEEEEAEHAARQGVLGPPQDAEPLDVDAAATADLIARYKELHGETGIPPFSWREVDEATLEVDAEELAESVARVVQGRGAMQPTSLLDKLFASEASLATGGHGAADAALLLADPLSAGMLDVTACKLVRVAHTSLHTCTCTQQYTTRVRIVRVLAT